MKQRHIVKVVQPVNLDEINVIIYKYEWTSPADAKQYVLTRDQRWREYQSFQILSDEDVFLKLPGFIGAVYLPWLQEALQEHLGEEVWDREV